ncbi:metallophosphoesterase family protein [Nocardia fluminea]|uniref:hypothetical protein n=1 Tax=Nocardia fluminea TaxID=134984 RepID=UPI0036576DF5
MSTIWLTADLHLGHKLVAGLRGFGEDTAAHDAELARRWDYLVKPDDQVRILGDLCLGRRGLDYALDWVSQRPGIKDLVFGNHDAGHPMHAESHKVQADYLTVFRSAQQSGIQKIYGHRVMLSHFPFVADHTEGARYPEWRPKDAGQWLIHGHTHSDRRGFGRQIHVGLDAHGLAPVPVTWAASVMRAHEKEPTE